MPRIGNMRPFFATNNQERNIIELAVRETPVQLVFGIVVDANAAMNTANVRLAGSATVTRCIIPRGGEVHIGDRVLVAKSRGQTIVPMILTAIEMPHSLTGVAGGEGEEVVPDKPIDVRAFGVPGAIVVLWDADINRPGVVYTVQESTDGTDATATTVLITQGSVYVHDAADMNERWFRVRTASLTEHGMYVSGWSDWVSATPEPFAATKPFLFDRNTSPYIWTYDTIQEAIDAASNGQYVIVPPGVYEESITLKDGVPVVEMYSGTVEITAPDDELYTVTCADGGFLQVDTISIHSSLDSTVSAVHAGHSGECTVLVRNIVTSNTNADGLACGVLSDGNGELVIDGAIDVDVQRSGYGIRCNSGTVRHSGDIACSAVQNSAYGIRHDGGVVEQVGDIDSSSDGVKAYGVGFRGDTGIVSINGDVYTHSTAATCLVIGVRSESASSPTLYLKGSITCDGGDEVRGIYATTGYNLYCTLHGDIAVTATGNGAGLDVYGGSYTLARTGVSVDAPGSLCTGVRAQDSASVVFLYGYVEASGANAADIDASGSATLDIGDVMYEPSKSSGVDNDAVRTGTRVRHTGDIDQEVSTGDPLVVGLRGIPIATTHPSDGQVYRYSSSANVWYPDTISSSGSSQAVVGGSSYWWHVDGRLVPEYGLDGMRYVDTQIRVSGIVVYAEFTGAPIPPGDKISVGVDYSSDCGTTWAPVAKVLTTISTCMERAADVVVPAGSWLRMNITAVPPTIDIITHGISVKLTLADDAEDNLLPCIGVA